MNQANKKQQLRDCECLKKLVHMWVYASANKNKSHQHWKSLLLFKKSHALNVRKNQEKEKKIPKKTEYSI